MIDDHSSIMLMIDQIDRSLIKDTINQLTLGSDQNVENQCNICVWRYIFNAFKLGADRRIFENCNKSGNILGRFIQ